MIDVIPEWLLDGPARGPSVPQDESGEGGQWVSSTLASPAQIAPGTQEDTLSRLCWWASRHLDQDIAQAVLTQWVLALPLSQPHDPWSSEHVCERLDRAYAKASAEPTGKAAGLVAVAPARSYFKTPRHMTWPEQDWIVEPFVAPGCCTEVVGKVKKGKSTLVYQLIAACINGTGFLDKPTWRTPVVLLTEQVGSSLRKTLERAGLLDCDDLHALTKSDLKAAGGWAGATAAALELCQETGAKLIVVDTLSRMAGLAGDAENKAGAVQVLDVLDAARAAGIACLLVRHARKGTAGFVDDDAADVARGTSAITGDMDIIIQHRQLDDDFRKLSFQSRITDDPEPLFLQYRKGVYVVVEEPQSKSERKFDDRLERVRAAMQKFPGGSLRILAAEVEMSPTTVSKYIDRLLNGASASRLETE